MDWVLQVNKVLGYHSDDGSLKDILKDVYKRQPIGRPVSFPRSFAACNPALVRSTIISRSYSANEAKIPN